MTEFTEYHKKQREKRITGTRLAKILGLSKYGGPVDVWLELTRGHGTDEPDPESQDILRGTYLEPAVMRWYEHRTGLKARKGVFRVHKEYPIIGCTPDGYAGTHNKDSGITTFDRALEIKCPRYGWDWGKEHTDEIPAYHVPQTVLEMACTGYEQCDVIALIYGELRIYTLKRDKAVEQAMIDIALDWYDQHITKGEPPEIDDTKAYTRYLSERFPTSETEILSATEDQEIEIRRVLDAKMAAKAAEAQERLGRNRLCAAIGGNAGVEGLSGRVTWKQVKGKLSTNHSGVISQLAGLYEIPDETVEQAIADNTGRNSGYRRFVVTNPKEE